MVALGKAMSTVKSLQSRQVKEENRRSDILLPHPFAAGLGQFKEVGHIGQAGHVVVIHAAVLALFGQKPGQGLIQDAFIGSLIGRVMPLKGIPRQA